MTDIQIYQIYYDEESRSALDPEFLPLDNSANERPDWREYHPIRRFLLGRDLKREAYYGFLSPKFSAKTGLTAAEVKRFVTAHHGADAMLFCPFFDQSAFFLNVFQQGEHHHRGLSNVAQAFVRSARLDVDVHALVNDSTNTVFANFFVARATFWKEWLRLGELLYAQAEEPRSSLVAAAQYIHAPGVQFKVFLVERLASLLLSTTPSFRAVAYDPTSLPWAMPSMSRFVRQARVCDALKIAFRATGRPALLDEYFAVRSDVMARVGAPPAAESADIVASARNELCPCGSGKRFKHCHGALQISGQLKDSK
jgi:hypothetical protein